MPKTAYGRADRIELSRRPAGFSLARPWDTGAERAEVSAAVLELGPVTAAERPAWKCPSPHNGAACSGPWDHSLFTALDHSFPGPAGLTLIRKTSIRKTAAERTTDANAAARALTGARP